jgi:hypothetical protein
MINEEKKNFLSLKSPFSEITGLEYMTIVNGYCTSGKYCIQNCSHAWS